MPRVFAMRNLRGIIALDLDDTLLNSKKELSDRNLSALEDADAAGYVVVPATGRFFDGMPAFIRDLPMLRYAITCNGSELLDIDMQKVLYRAEIPWQRAVALMEYLDRFDLIYDCFMNGFGRISAAMKLKIDDIVSDHVYSRKMLHELRLPVPELKSYLRQEQTDVQKVQFFTREPSLTFEILEKLAELFPDLQISSAIPGNVELNALDATKGKALLFLAEHLDMRRSQTYAFGDGLNDISMLRDAGIGIAMENAPNTVKLASDTVTGHCDEDGVADYIEKYLLP